MAKSILISISPNTSFSDTLLAAQTIFQPWTWKKGRYLNQLSKKLKNLLNFNHCYLLNSGRTALYLALKSLNLKSSDEVLCQAFTCVAVPNAIRWAGAKPIFVDTPTNSFNLDINDLKKKITPNSKAIIVQHTFGIPAPMAEIKTLCNKHHLTLIEDCAHSLGARYHNQPIGSFADMTILSFGRDKAISSVFGGALLTNQPLDFKSFKPDFKFKFPSFIWILKQLLHPIIMAVIVPLYFFLNLGKLLLFLYQKSGWLTFPVSRSEKKGRQSLKVRLLPNALACLALHQFNQLDKVNHNRQAIAHLYQKNLNQPPLTPGATYLRYPFLIDQPQSLINQAKKHHILLGSWYRPVIAPQGVNLRKIGYQLGSCPNAEFLSSRIVNLPTHPKMSLKDAKRVIKIIKPYVNP